MLKIKKTPSLFGLGGMALALFVTSALSAQPDTVMNINLQVLAWDHNIKAVVAQADADPVAIAANRKRVSGIYKVKTANPLTLYHPAGEGANLGEPMVSVALKPGMRDILLILSEKQGRCHAALLPFAQKDFPENTATFFNLTSFPVFSQIDGQRQTIKAKARHQVPYKYAYAEKESLRTKFAVERDGRMRLVQNSTVPLMNDGRVLFFISETENDPNRKSRYPVTFTYAYDVMPDPNRAASDQTIEEIDAQIDEMLSAP